MASSRGIQCLSILCIVTIRIHFVFGSNCSVSEEGSVVDCRHRGYTGIPDDIANSSDVTYLNLCGNSISTLGPRTFSQFPSLTSLNLSTTGIKIIDELALEGLNHLKVLDLTNNPILYQFQDLPNSLFNHSTKISHLFISGAPLKGNIFLPLKNLTELTMTPDSNFMPYELTQLAKLRVINFAFCQMGPNLTKEYLQNFSSMEIKELAFHSCEFHSIENNTFDDFRHLRLLNLAGNTDLKVNDVFNAISYSRDLMIEDLVLDLVGSSYRIASVLLGPDKHGNCLPGLKYLKNLSCRGINLLGFLKNFTICFSSMESLSVGFNAPYILDGIKEDQYGKFTKVRYLDISYLMVMDRPALKQFTGFWKSESWIPPNKSFFPKRVPEWDNIPCVIPSNVLQHKQCHQADLPRCLVYIRVDHTANIGNIRTDACANFKSNRMRYLNISFHMHDHDLDVSNMAAYGLDYLEIFDGSGCGISKFSTKSLSSLPGLRELYLRQNSFGSNTLPMFPELPQLEVLDLSENFIAVIPMDMLRNVPKLRKIRMYRNELTSMDFLGMEYMQNLKYVDMSANKILYISQNLTSKLDNLHPNMTLDLNDNPLQCDCDHQKMLHWIQTTTINLIHKDLLRCHDSKMNGTLIADINLRSMRIQCAFNKILVASLTSGVTVLLLMSFLIVYRYRWALRWHYYKTIYLRTQKISPENLLDELHESAPFSTFIIYPIDDDAARRWVIEVLRKRIEYDWNRNECFLRGRDDMPGKWDYDNIVEGLLRSKSALWVVCPNFFEDKWCQSASNFAMMHLGAANNAFLVMEDRYEEYSQPNQLQKLLTRKHGVPLIHYPDDENGQNMFWSRLESFVPI